MKFLSEVFFQGLIKALGLSEGDLLMHNGTSLVALTPGDAGKVLTSAGPGNALTYEPGSQAEPFFRPDIVSAFGGGAGKLDEENSADYAEGDAIAFKDANDFLWTYVLVAGTVTGASISSVSAASNTITSSTTEMQNLKVGDRILWVTGGTPPTNIAERTIYYIKTKPTSTTATISTTDGGPTFDFIDTGTGAQFWVRYEGPQRYIPKDYHPSTQAFYWQQAREKYHQSHLSFKAFETPVTLTNALLARHTFPFDIIGWGISTENPVAIPGSGGGSTPLSANLIKSTNFGTSPGALLSVSNLGLSLGQYYAHMDFENEDDVISVGAGEALYLTILNQGNDPPGDLEVHLVIRRVVYIL